MAIKNWAWKPEVNKNVRLSTATIVINHDHRLWPYNLGMPIIKFIFIEVLVISQI